MFWLGMAIGLAVFVSLSLIAYWLIMWNDRRKEQIKTLKDLIRRIGELENKTERTIDSLETIESYIDKRA